MISLNNDLVININMYVSKEMTRYMITCNHNLYSYSWFWKLLILTFIKVVSRLCKMNLHLRELSVIHELLSLLKHLKPLMISCWLNWSILISLCSIFFHLSCLIDLCPFNFVQTIQFCTLAYLSASNSDL